MSLQERMIDLANYNEEDLLASAQGDTLSIQVVGDANVNIFGKHSELEDYLPVGIINICTIEKLTGINGAGLYICPITGLDQIKLEVSGSGKIHWRMLGE